MSNVLKNRWIKNLVKGLFVVALLYYLAKKGFLSLDAMRNAFEQWQYIASAYLLLLLAGFASIYRWHILVKAQGIEFPLLRTFELSYVGIFFNIALPGAVSGDVVKAIYVGREVEGK